MVGVIVDGGWKGHSSGEDSGSNPPRENGILVSFLVRLAPSWLGCVGENIEGKHPSELGNHRIGPHQTRDTAYWVLPSMTVGILEDKYIINSI